MDVDVALAQATLDEMAVQGISAPRLAALSGIPERTVYALLTGRQSVRAHQVEALAAGLALRGSELLARAEDLLVRPP